jgi:hypothetical protein
VLTMEECERHYPDCKVAVAWCERYMHDDGDGTPSVYDTCRCYGLGPEDVRAMIRETLAEEQRLLPPGLDYDAVVFARREVELPSFLTYLKGVLGAV